MKNAEGMQEYLQLMYLQHTHKQLPIGEKQGLQHVHITNVINALMHVRI